MNKNLVLILFVLINHVAFGQEARYEMNTAKSKILWEATYIMGGGHEGTLLLTSGNLVMVNTLPKNGDFVIDMKSMTCSDLTDKQSALDLVNHLKSDDFFSADKFPQAYFAIVDASPDKLTGELRVTGILQIKEAANTISFPVVLKSHGGEMIVNAIVVIDRTKWGITYQSKSIFTDLKDGVISDLIKINLELVFSKAQ
jgi:polyisoprenoid-binding protein YceI